MIREQIATHYKITLQQALAEVEVQQGGIDKKLVYAHPTFVEPMLDYIVADFEKSRGALNDASIGGMVICDSSEQAKQMFEIFNAKYAKGPMPAVEQVNDNDLPYSKAAQPESAY